MSGALDAALIGKLLLPILFESKDRTFQTTTDSFLSAFPPPARFSSLCTALLLLEDSKALLLPQRIATWYLLHTSWSDGPAANPFISFILRAYENPAAASVERKLCLQLLTQQELQQLSSRRPSEYVLTDGLNPQPVPLPPATDELWKELQRTYVHLKREQPEASNQAEAQASATSPSPSLQLPPGTIAWQRPAPPALPLLPDEMFWLYPDLHTELMWDSSLGESGSEAAEVRDLVSRALRAPLLPAQQQRILSALDSSPRLVHRLGVLPHHFPSLVEYCPALASALLLRMLLPGPSGRAAELLEVLARSEMSLHGMEVVNRLAASVQLPPEFVHLYITNCIHSCVHTQDKYVQSRLVRLVCVFLQSLIRNRILAAVDLLHELQAFCINFSRIREAAKLFRLLKQIEGGGAYCLSPTGAGGPSGSGATAGDAAAASFRSLGDVAAFAAEGDLSEAEVEGLGLLVRGGPGDEGSNGEEGGQDAEGLGSVGQLLQPQILRPPAVAEAAGSSSSSNSSAGKSALTAGGGSSASGSGGGGEVHGALGSCGALAPRDPMRHAPVLATGGQQQ